MKKARLTRFWVVRESDGRLYCTNLKPYRSYRSEYQVDYEWCTEGDFMEVDLYGFDGLKFTDDPVEVNISKKEFKIEQVKSNEINP